MIVNVSRLEEFASCPKKYEHRYESQGAEFPFGFEEERFSDSPLDFGSAIHVGLARYYQTRSREEALDAYNMSIKWVEEKEGSDGEPHALATYGLKMLSKYFEHYEEADREWEVVATERSFEFPLRRECPLCKGAKRHAVLDALGTPVVLPCARCASMGAVTDTLVGRWDLLVRVPFQANTLWHVQHKTVGSTVGLANYARRYDLADHERLYIPAAEREFPRDRIGGTILNLLRKSKVIGPEKDFLRYYIPATSHKVESFMRTTRKRIAHLEESQRDGVWDMNTQHCMAYNRLCPFHDLCLGFDVDLADRFQARAPDYVDEMRALAAQKGAR